MYDRYCVSRVKEGLLACSLSKNKSVFYKHFNLGSGNPRTDTCSSCAKLLLELKSTVDLEQKNNIRTDYRLHKLRAKRFFSILNENNDNELSVCLDCQQNQPWPKLSIG